MDIEKELKQILNDSGEEIGVGPKKEQKIIKFISQALKTQREQIVGKIEKIKEPLLSGDWYFKEEMNGCIAAKNKQVDDIIKEIKEMK